MAFFMFDILKSNDSFFIEFFNNPHISAGLETSSFHTF
jgi:hypothetical protein